MGLLPRKITTENLSKSKRLPHILEMIARRRATQEIETESEQLNKDADIEIVKTIEDSELIKELNLAETDIDTGLEKLREEEPNEEIDIEISKLIVAKSELVQQKSKTIELYKDTIRQEKVHDEIDKKLKSYDKNVRDMVKQVMDQFAPRKQDLNTDLFVSLKALLEKNKERIEDLEEAKEFNPDESKNEIMENANSEETLKLLSISGSRALVGKLKSKDVSKMSEEEKDLIKSKALESFEKDIEILLGLRDSEEFSANAKEFIEKIGKIYGKNFVNKALGSKTMTMIELNQKKKALREMVPKDKEEEKSEEKPKIKH